ncbi:MAG: M1 family metallopeptidase [Nakamurella sp.]
MSRSPLTTVRYRPLAAIFLAIALCAGCASSVSGLATTGTAQPVTRSTTSSSSPTTDRSQPTTAKPSGQVTVPSSRATASSTAVVPSEPDGATGTIGDPGIGDLYYPTEGNGGYQVDSYDLTLSYDPPTNTLQSTALIAGSVLSDEGLTQFNLDLQPNLTVSAVTVNDAPATFSQEDSELVITPAALLPAQSPLTVSVTYGGQPGLVAGGTAGLGDGGWYRTDSGGAFAAGEPVGASTWFPVNEHPADTASFAVTATVPEKWKVISNGVQQIDGLPDPGAGNAVFRWKLDQAVASYLTTIYIDTFETVEDTMADGKPIVSAIAADAPAEAKGLAMQTKSILEVLASYFGPYPFDAAGGIFINTQTGFALETATRPVYSGQSADLDTVVHELAHQWYGDDVTVQRWSDICLNECFASYAPWLYAEKVNNGDLDAFWKRQMAQVVDTPDFWSSPLVDMGPGNEFTSVYSRGPLALHALRAEIGDEAFLKMLQEWPATYGGKNATWDEFEAYVTTLAGRDMAPFMDAWFRGSTVPDEDYRYPGDLGP